MKELEDVMRYMYKEFKSVWCWFLVFTIILMIYFILILVLFFKVASVGLIYSC